MSDRVVRREDFIPEVIWTRGSDGFFLVPVRRQDDPDRWTALCRSDEGIATQVDDGEDRYGGKGVMPTSSSSAPWVMARMLDLLDLRDGMAVLEVGTGTGYNAALLAERTPAGAVTSIEIDPAIAEQARTALDQVGLPVTVVVGDGEAGVPDRAPFDRIIVTASVARVPYAWVEQTRPGGRIVLPFTSEFGGALLTLTVADGAGCGRFDREAGFMPLRGQRPDPPAWRHGDPDIRTTDRELRAPFDDPAAGFAVNTRMPGCALGRLVEGGAAPTLLLSHAPSGSWASLRSEPDRHEIAQHGPRRLWDELEAAYDWWDGLGRPGCDRFGLTVTPEGQTFWCDQPDQTIPTPCRADADGEAS
ncbi:methyltransferase domain-containing protein [Frankia sp. R82]|uniref:methyltransferase domain-containing protein n=1 Tax=Frankia sp. R82 TaxID=2950553 RepID=UPI002044C673|nr:methyltransferase domain-containing protein [Frankia sp. R82]MCM3883328.1 methyltransferase domain-containing protein [Frankia sp. R82]